MRPEASRSGTVRGRLLPGRWPDTLGNVSGAAFGQLNFRILDAWSIARVHATLTETKEFYGRRAIADALAQPGAAARASPGPLRSHADFPPGKLEQDFSNTSLRLGTEFRFSDDLFRLCIWSRKA